MLCTGAGGGGVGTQKWHMAMDVAVDVGSVRPGEIFPKLSHDVDDVGTEAP